MGVGVDVLRVRFSGVDRWSGCSLDRFTDLLVAGRVPVGITDLRFVDREATPDALHLL
jgi:hypothetical protein